MRTLRVLTISHMFPSVRSSRHGIFMVREARYLRRYDIECSFLVARPWTPWPLYHIPRWRDYGPANPLAPPDGLQVRQAVYLRPPGLAFRQFEGESMARSLLPVARSWHENEPFDLVLGVSMLPDAEAAVIVGGELGLPVVSLAVGSDVMVYPDRMPALWRRLSDTLARVDLPVGVSQSICRRLSETGRCRREPLCIYLSRDTNQFKPTEAKTRVREKLGWPTDRIVAIYVGGLVDSKGMNELAAAAEPLLHKYKHFQLVCVGDGPSLARLRGLRDRLHVADAIVLPGRIAPEEVPLFLQASDFFVLPSHSEGMPQAVLETMNCGLPVVATRVGGVPEAVMDGETGLLVDAKNVDHLRDAMERMIADEDFRLSAGRKGAAHACEVFDSERNAETFADALWSLVDESVCPPMQLSGSIDG